MSHVSNIKRETRVTVPLPGQTYTAEDGTISEVIEDSINENYEPSQQEIEEFARWMGMSLPEDAPFLWIAKEGLRTPLPKEWKPCRTDKGEIYYFNFKTGESSWEHPMDELFRTKFEQEKSRQANQTQKPKMTSKAVSQNVPNTQKSSTANKQIMSHANNNIKNGHIGNGTTSDNNNNSKVNVNDKYTVNNNVQLSCWHSPRAEMSNISSSPNVSSVNADSSLSFEKINKSAMHHTLSSDTETTLYDRSDSTSLSFLTPGKSGVEHASAPNSFNTIPSHLNKVFGSSSSNGSNANSKGKNNFSTAPMSPLYTSPFSTPTISTRALPLSTPTSNIVSLEVDDGTHTSSTRIVSEAEKALETRIRSETESSFDAFRQKAKEVQEGKISELQAWEDEEIAKIKVEFTSHEHDLQMTLERAKVEHKTAIEEQMRSKYNEEIVLLTEQLETLKKQKEEYDEEREQQHNHRENKLASAENKICNQSLRKEKKEEEEEQKIMNLQREAKEHVESEIRERQGKILEELTNEYSARKEELENAFRNTCEHLQKEFASSIHEREVNIATATEKRRKELTDAIHNLELEIATLREGEKEALVTGTATATTAKEATTQNLSLSSSNAEAIHTVQAQYDDEKRKLCEVKENEIKTLQEQLHKLEKYSLQEMIEMQQQEKEEQCASSNKDEKEKQSVSIHDKSSNTTSITMDELKAKHAGELKRVDEMYKALRSKLEKSLHEELNTLNKRNKEQQSSASLHKANTATVKVNTVSDSNVTVNEKQLIENALEADMQVYISEVQQRRARAKELFDVQRAKLVAAHELQHIKEERERTELTSTIVQERVDEELERERVTVARAHAEALARLETQCTEEKKSLINAIDEEMNAFLQEKRKERSEKWKEFMEIHQDETCGHAMNRLDDKQAIAHNDKTAKEEELERKVNELLLEKLNKQEKHNKEVIALAEKLQSTQHKIHTLETTIEEHKTKCYNEVCAHEEQQLEEESCRKMYNNDITWERHVNAENREEYELWKEEELKNMINDYKVKEVELKEELMQWRSTNAKISEEIRHEIIERELNDLALQQDDSNNDYSYTSNDNDDVSAPHALTELRNACANKRIATPLTNISRLNANNTHNKLECISKAMPVQAPITPLAKSSHASSSSSSSLSWLTARHTPLTSREAQWYCQAQLDHLSQREAYLQELRNEYQRSIECIDSDKERASSLVPSEHSSHSLSDSLRYVNEELFTVLDVLNKRMNTLANNVHQLSIARNTTTISSNDDINNNKLIISNTGKEISQLDDKWRTHLTHLYSHCLC